MEELKKNEIELIYVDIYFAGNNGCSKYLKIKLDKDIIEIYNIKEENTYSILDDEYNLILEKEIKKDKYFNFPHSIIIISEETYKECTE